MLSMWIALALIIVACILLYFFQTKCATIDKDVILKVHDQGIFEDEKGNRIDHKTLEREEQRVALEYIRPTAHVLELGARYGTVTCIIDKCLCGPTFVTSEPDPLVYAALMKNLVRNGCTNVRIVRGIVGDNPVYLQHEGYSTHIAKEKTDYKIPNLTLSDLQKRVGFQFDTLMADCEGCIEEFIRHCIRHNALHQFNTIIYEKDFPETCNYEWIAEVLSRNGMTKVRDAFLTVWTR